MQVLCYAINGGGEIVYDFAYRVFGRSVFKTSKYKKTNQNAPSLLHNYLLSQTFFDLSDSELIEKTQKLCHNMNAQSQQTIYQIISRTKSAALSPTNRIFHLTKHEEEALQIIKQDFHAHICELAPEVFYYQGYFLPTKHFEPSVFYYKHGLDSFSPRTLDKIKNLNIVDVGGFIGDSAIVFQNFTDKNIYSFEATNHNYALMLQTIKLNNANRIVPVKKALGSEQATMTISVFGSGSSLVRDNTRYGSAQSEEVELITLDSYVKEHGIQVGLIKVDIEGFEMEFLKGAKDTICSQKPAMILSIYHQASDFFDIKPMIESWNLGYTFHIYKPLDGNISLETTLMCEVLD